ncbi:MAG: AAA family ATPase [Candidatus Sulfotelmatobacter sp.]
MGKLTQFYPHCLAFKQERIGGDYCEDDFWFDVGYETTSEPDGCVLVPGLYPKDPRIYYIREQLEKEVVDLSRVQFFMHLDVEKKLNIPAESAREILIESLSSLEEISNPPKMITPIRRFGIGGEVIKQDVKPIPALPAREVTRKYQRRISFSNVAGLQAIEQAVRDGASVKNLLKSLAGEPSSHRVKAILIVEPEEGDLKYLPDFQKNCPAVDVYIYHGVYEEKWGVEITGDSDNWEEEFPALGQLRFDGVEEIVHDFLIKGSIHIFAGRFETYKTMAAIELSAAILEGRLVFDQFAVLHRYPILFLEEDMSGEQFADYAAPFNLAKHGNDFRVKHPKNIMHSIDSPALQQAVRGRILILDTMLDFAAIENAYESGEWVKFMQSLRELMTVHGCVAIIMTAHATKTGAKSSDIDPSEYFKDSATFGGKVDIGYGFKALPATSQIEIKRIKGRGFKKPLNFTIAVLDGDGNSNLSNGRFPVYQKPGEFKKQGRPAKREPEMLQQIKTLKTEGQSNREIAESLSIGETTVRRILKQETFDYDKGEKHDSQQ